jgi:hypothetical protein
MNHYQVWIALFLIGVGGHLVMRKSMDIGRKVRELFDNDRGEGEAGGEGEVKFDAKQQAFVDKLIAAKTADYHAKLTPVQKQLEELSKFKTEYEKSQETKNQEELIKQKKYEEAEGNYKKQINDFSGKLSAKDTEIQDLKINHSLVNEISKQGGFTEESLAMIRGSATIDAQGNIVIKSKDANGADITVPVADGVKKLLTERPHLVRSTFKGGGGTGGGQGDGGSGGSGGAGGEESLESLNARYAEAIKGTDLKLRSELKGKINAALAKKRSG